MLRDDTATNAPTAGDDTSTNGRAVSPTGEAMSPPLHSTAPPPDAAAPPSAATPPPSGLWPVFQNPSFLTLWSGQVFSQLADKVYLVLMIAIIASQFEAPGQTISGWVSAIMIAFTIPAVLFGSLAGVYVDRWRKKPVLVLTNLLRGLLVIGLPLVLWATQPLGTVAGVPVSFGCLLVVTFGVSTLTQFFAPAEQSALPLIVQPRHLLPANSLYTTTMMGSVIIGFAVGEPLLALADTLLAPLDQGTGIGKSILVGLSYGLAGLLLLRLQVDETPPKPGHTHVWADIKDGLRYLGGKPRLRNAMVQLVLLFSVFAALAVLAVRLAEVLPTIKSSQFGFLLAAGGVGMGLGAALVGQFGGRLARPRLSLVGSMGMAVMLVGVSVFTTRLWPCLLLIGGLGLFAAMVGIPMQTTIQERTPEEMRGKVFGLQNNVANIALSLPLALAGLAEAWVGLRGVFLGLATIVVFGGGLTWSVMNVTDSEDA